MAAILKLDCYGNRGQKRFVRKTLAGEEAMSTTYRPPSQRSSKVPTPDYACIKRALVCLSPHMINCKLFLVEIKS